MFARYVAIGDSQTEGLDDPDGRGGFIGWADRLAGHLAVANPDVRYANLAVRGRRTQQIRDQQLAPAIAMRPDLATVMSGVNDLRRRDFDPRRVAGLIEDMIARLQDAGAHVATCTFPDMGSGIPFGSGMSSRIRDLNEHIRAAAERQGATLVDFERLPVSTDHRLWSEDRIHANTVGHTRIAAAFAHGLAVPGVDERWRDPFPAAPPAPAFRRVSGDARWVGRYVLPAAVRHLRGRSSGDGITAKRPTLEPVMPRPAG